MSSVCESPHYLFLLNIFFKTLKNPKGIFGAPKIEDFRGNNQKQKTAQSNAQIIVHAFANLMEKNQ